MNYINGGHGAFPKGVPFYIDPHETYDCEVYLIIETLPTTVNCQVTLLACSCAPSGYCRIFMPFASSRTRINENNWKIDYTISIYNQTDSVAMIDTWRCDLLVSELKAM